MLGFAIVRTMTEGNKPTDRDVTSVRLAASERVTSLDPRTHAAWRTWLAALAKDAAAAHDEHGHTVA